MNVKQHKILNTSSPLVSVIAAGFSSGMIRAAGTLLTVVACSGLGNYARAETTKTEKVGNKMDEAGTEINKDGRKMKKKVRDATGNSSLKKDVGETVDNVQDSASDTVKKAKRKVD